MTSLIGEGTGRFNPYSPGFSIYLYLINYKEGISEGFNPYSPGFSIYLSKIFTQYDTY